MFPGILILIIYFSNLIAHRKLFHLAGLSPGSEYASNMQSLAMSAEFDKFLSFAAFELR